VSVGYGELPIPTYVGCLETKEDAFRLLEGVFRGILQHSSGGPRGVPSALQSGHIFIWEQEISGVQDWDDGASWTPVCLEDGFWISRKTTVGDGLLKKTIDIPAQGRFHHFVFYCRPWDAVNGTLRSPCEDPCLGSIILRPELASQLANSSSSTKQSRLLRAMIKVKPSPETPSETNRAHNMQTCSSTGRLQFIRSALLFCLCCTDEGQHEHLLRRTPGDWFPSIPSNPAYYRELASRSLLRGKKWRELKIQMMLLLFKLIETSNGPAASRVRRNDPSKEFSAMQNRSLLGEIFRISHDKPASLRQCDPARLSAALARSVPFRSCPGMAPVEVEIWKNGLMQILPINSPAYGVSFKQL